MQVTVVRCKLSAHPEIFYLHSLQQMPSISFVLKSFCFCMLLIWCCSCVWGKTVQIHIFQVTQEVERKKESEVTQLCPTLCDPLDCVACHAPSSMGFSRQEYWSELSFPSPGYLPDSGIIPRFPALQEDSTVSATRKAQEVEVTFKRPLQYF